MEILGWILFSLLAIFGLAILVVFAIPFIVTETTMMKEKIKRSVSDKKYDLDKRSEQRRNRDALKREKENELAEKKLEAKMLKVDKQIELQQKRISLAKELKEQAEAEKADLVKIKAEKKAQNKVEAKTVIVADEDAELINTEE